MDDLLNDFLTEVSESLTLLDLELVKLEQNPDNKDILGNIFRVVHTVKGTCGFLGLPRLEHVAHAGENILGKIRDGKIAVNADIISLVLEGLDCIKEIMAYLEANEKEPEGEDTELINRLNACAETGKIGGTIAAASAPAEEVDLMKEAEAFIAAEAAAAAAASAPAEEPDLMKEAEAIIAAELAAAAAAAAQAAEVHHEVEAPHPVEKPAAKADHDNAVAGGSAANQSIRVNLSVLENLMQLVSELLLTRNQLLQIFRSSSDMNFLLPLQHLSQITSDIQDGIMKTRMQPIGNAWAKFPRLIRDLSLELGKKIDLHMSGEETELDRQLLEMVKDPLTHMVRNSADHGLETIQGRKDAGKSENGTISLSAYHEGGYVIIKIADDGRGIDVNRVAQKAVENGLATESEIQSMSEQQIIQFIFKAGFSTAEKITAVSGRGVGMDVVQTNIEKIGGTIELTSTKGKGSVFLIKIPLTLAIMQVLIVECRGQHYAIPQIRVVEIVRASKQAEEENTSDTGYKIEMLNGIPVLRLRGKLLPIVVLSEVLGKGSCMETEQNEFLVVVCQVGSGSFGLIVDKIFDTEEIVVKPVSPALKNIPEYSGNTILGDGKVIMILDPTGIIKSQSGGMVGDNEDLSQSHADHNQRTSVDFLLFHVGDKSPKAVPLELVSRLEEIDFSTLEWSGEAKVVQYREDLMRIVTLDPAFPIPESGVHQVVVFADEDKIMGLVVDEIIDIVEHDMDIKSLTGQNGVLGSMVINNKTTDMIDISHYFSHTFVDWLEDKTRKSSTKASDVEHILLIDDSAFFRKFMAPILTVANYKVTTVDSAIKALKMLEDGFSCTLIVSDIDMPEMTGIDFVRICRKDERFKHLPIVALTAYNSEEMIQEITEAGFNSFVSKSDRNRLLSVINDILDKTEAA